VRACNGGALKKHFLFCFFVPVFLMARGAANPLFFDAIARHFSIIDSWVDQRPIITYPHDIIAVQVRLFPLSNRAKRPTSAQYRALSSRGGEGGVFLTACGEQMRTGTKSWLPKCVAQGAPQNLGGFLFYGQN
jgi:hypothetical protein